LNVTTSIPWFTAADFGVENSTTIQPIPRKPSPKYVFVIMLTFTPLTFLLLDGDVHKKIKVL